MSKSITIQAVPPAGHNTHGAAFRLWGTSPVLVEVLDTEDDPPMVDFEVKDAHGNVSRVEPRPHPTCIGQRSFREIKANPRIRYTADGETTDGQAFLEIKAAKDISSKLSGELTDERVAHEKTKSLLEQAKLALGPVAQERDALSKKVTELTALLESASAPAATAPKTDKRKAA